MLRRAWPIVVATCAMLAACVDDQQALQSSEPLYTMVFFATDSTALNKRARDQIADFVANPIGTDQDHAEGQGLRRWPFRQDRNGDR